MKPAQPTRARRPTGLTSAPLPTASPEQVRWMSARARWASARARWVPAPGRAPWEAWAAAAAVEAAAVEAAEVEAVVVVVVEAEAG
jgi:hypothetical protein